MEIVMALSLKWQMFVEEFKEGLASGPSDEDAMMMFGMCGEGMFNADGSVNELGTTLADILKQERPHLASRVDTFMQASGTAAP
jgi:hypothetical protein